MDCWRRSPQAYSFGTKYQSEDGLNPTVGGFHADVFALDPVGHWWGPGFRNGWLHVVCCQWVPMCLRWLDLWWSTGKDRVRLTHGRDTVFFNQLFHYSNFKSQLLPDFQIARLFYSKLRSYRSAISAFGVDDGNISHLQLCILCYGLSGELLVIGSWEQSIIFQTYSLPGRRDQKWSRPLSRLWSSQTLSKLSEIERSLGLSLFPYYRESRFWSLGY